MSKEIDERVVEMKFDNRDFESNVKATMSTLDKLKNALKLPASSTALNGIANSARNATSNLSGVGAAVETVNARFSALQVVGITALSNITTAAMRAGSNLINSFSFEPIVSGFQEYETQLNAVQTILANTSSKGTTMDQVTAALDELNTYADKTIYNFTEMTRNIGTFTAAGVDLDTSVSAIQGIANLAAVSGSTSQQASTAMYQLSQALAAGRVSLMDWNSVVNAGMGGEVFQNALKRTAKAMGKDVDAIIEKYGSFRESLTSGEWLTTDVLTETLSQFTMAAEEGTEEWEKFKASLMEKGYTEEQAVEILNMANTATDAATKVKTFTQLMDTLKEAMGSGWAKTWQLIFGDFEEAREFWTGISDGLGELINNFSDARNNVIEAAMGGGGSRWGEFSDQLETAGVSLDAFQSKLSEVYSASSGESLDQLIADYGSLEKAMASGKITADMVSETLNQLASSTDSASNSTKELAEWQKVVDDVWYGTYGNIDTGRMEKLAAAGWEYAEVQKLVNMTVDGHRLTLEDLTAAQIESMGYTKEQAEALAELASTAKESGSDINGLINDILSPKRSGRELFLEGLENTLTAILKPLQAIAGAFNDVFGMNSDQLYNLIAGFNEFSKMIILNDDDAENLRRTLKGLFSVIHLISTSVGKTLTIAFKTANAILAPFGTNVLELTGNIGDAIYQFDRMISSSEFIEDALSSLGDIISGLLQPLKDFWDSMFPDDVAVAANNPITILVTAFEALRSYFESFEGLSIGEIFTKLWAKVQEVFNKLKNLRWTDVLSGIRNFSLKAQDAFENLVKGMKNVGPDVIAGLQNGLKEGVENVLRFLEDLATKLIEVVKAILGIQSPSTVFFEIGKNIVEGLCNGIIYISGRVTETLRAIIDDVKGVMSEVDWGAVMAVGFGVGSFIALYQLTDAMQTFATAVKGFSAPFQSVGNILNTTDQFLKKLTDGNATNKGFKNIADGVKVLAEAIAILVGSIAALTLLDQGKMWEAVAVIGALAVIIGVLAAALNKFANGGNVLSSLQLNSTLISIGASFLLLSAAAKILGTMDENAIKSAKTMLTDFALIIALLIASTSRGKELDNAAAFMRKIGTAFLLLAVSAKLLGSMSTEEIAAAKQMLVDFGLVVALLIAITGYGSAMDKAAAFIGKVGTAFLLLAITAKILGGMDPESMNKAISMIVTFGLIVTGLIAATKLAGSNSVDQIGDTILKISGAIALLAVTAKLIATMSWGDMAKAVVGILGLGAIVAALVAIVKLAGPGEMVKIGTSLLAMSLAIGILAGIAVLLSYVDAAGLAKGIIAVGALAAIVSMMTIATRGASDVKGTMMGIAVAIGVMAASIAVLSLLDTGKVMAATVCLSTVMAMFALIVKMGSNVQTSYKVVLSMAAVIGVLSLALYGLAQLPVASVLGSAVSLSLLLATLAAACKVLSGIQTVSSSALGAMGILTAVVAGLAVILGLMSGLGVEASIPTAASLSILLISMSAVTAILSAIGPAAQGAVAGAIAMAEVIGIVALVIAAIIGIAGLIGQIPGGVEFINKAGEVLSAIGEAIGSFISGIGVGLTSGLPEMAQNLSMFAIALQPFIISMKMIDSSIVESVTNLAAAILALTAAGVIDGILQLFGAGSAIGTIGDQLVPFGEAMARFAGSLEGVNLANLLVGSQAAKAIAEMASAMPKEGGILDSIFGSTVDLGTFGKQLASFGDGMRKYSESIVGINAEAINNSIPAAQGLAELAGKLPAEGGILQSIFGTNVDLGTFGTQLESFGNALKNYGLTVDGLKVEAIQNSVSAGQALSDLANALPKEDGWVDNFFGGKTDLGTFSTQLTSFGEALSEYSVSISEVDFSKMASSTTQVRSLLNLIKNNSDINMSGLDNIKKIKDIGEILNTYYGEISTVNSGSMEASIRIIKELISAISDMAGLDVSGVSTFQSAVSQLGQTNLDSLVETFSSAGSRLGDAGVNLIKQLASGMSSGTSAVTSAAKTIGDAAVKAISVYRVKFLVEGIQLLRQLAQGVSNGKSAITTAIRTALGTASSSIRSYYWTFRRDGAYISSGLAVGMESQLGRIREAAASMVAAAAVAVAAKAVIKSPSRLFMDFGEYMGQGLAIGMENEYSSIYNAGRSMGDTAYSGLKTTMSMLSSLVENDIDANPTIRPVIDLTDVRNGANQINGLFNEFAPLYSMGSAGSINRSMNSKIQNGTFNDVVDAVNKLRMGLDDIGKPSYNIGGITYESGSDVATAIEQLARAIKVERRL